MTASLLQQSLFQLLSEKSIDLQKVNIIVDNAYMPSSSEMTQAMNSSCSTAADFDASCKCIPGDFDLDEIDSDDETDEPPRSFRSQSNLVLDGASRWDSASTVEKSPTLVAPVRSAKTSWRKSTRQPRGLHPFLHNVAGYDSGFGSPSETSQLRKHHEVADILDEALGVAQESSPCPPQPPLSPLAKSPRLIHKVRNSNRSPLTSRNFRKTCHKAKIIF